MSEGGVDTDSLLDKDGNPNVDDGDDVEEIELDQFKPGGSSSRRGSAAIAHTSQTSTSHDSKYEETSFMGEGDGRSTLAQRERGGNEALDRIHESYPNADSSSFLTRMTEHDIVEVRLKRSDGVWRPLFKPNGELNAGGKKGVPPTLIESLGPSAEEIVAANEEEITSRSAKVRELRSALETADENQRESIRQLITKQENEIDGLERENEETEQRMSLRDRIKAIFKKYGFTLIGVLAAVGTVIGVIVSNLKQGLTTLGKGVGSGLKSIGKKLGEILPGLVGAIASFVFKTAGEVIGFLGKNAWLLIVGVVVFLIERLKKNTR